MKSTPAKITSDQFCKDKLMFTYLQNACISINKEGKQIMTNKPIIIDYNQHFTEFYFKLSLF